MSAARSKPGSQRSKEPSQLRQSEQTRRRIRRAAREYLWAHPFREMTVASIMTPLGISRPAFYQYYADVHEVVESLLVELREELEEAAGEWFTTTEDPIPALARTLAGVVHVTHDWGPLVRAAVEAAPMDERLERAWNDLVFTFDEAVTARIECDQAAGLIPELPARNVAIALNRMDVGTFVHHFGQHPRSDPQAVWESIARLWIGTLYGHKAWQRVEQDEL